MDTWASRAVKKRLRVDWSPLLRTVSRNASIGHRKMYYENMKKVVFVAMSQLVSEKPRVGKGY